jgi:copper(I)-binding protein
MRMLSAFIAAAFVAALSWFAPVSALAHDYTAGSIHVEHPWSRETPKGAKVAGGYFVIENKGTTPDRLIGGSAEIAGRFEIHEMKMDNGIMRMRELEKGIEIAPGKTVKLAPGGYHVMLMDLKKAPKQGESFMGTLVFEKAGKMEVKFVVAPIGSTDGKTKGGGQSANHMDHMDRMDRSGAMKR